MAVELTQNKFTVYFQYNIITESEKSADGVQAQRNMFEARQKRYTWTRRPWTISYEICSWRLTLKGKRSFTAGNIH